MVNAFPKSHKTKQRKQTSKGPSAISLIPYLIQNLLYLILLREKCLALAMETATVITFSRLHKHLENLLCNKYHKREINARCILLYYNLGFGKKKYEH